MPRPNVYKLKGSFGAFDGSKVYYHGFPKRPSFLPKSGRGFGGLKYLLQKLSSKFTKFTLTFTPEMDSILKQGSVSKIRLSAKAVKRLAQRRWDGNTELNTRLGNQLLSEAFPQHFGSEHISPPYKKGVFAEIIKGESFDPRLLTAEDRAAITK